MSGDRPPLSAALAADEFVRWYWLKEELQAFAREVGIRATGGKELLAARIEAHLAGRPFDEPRATPRGGAQLSGPLTAETRIPAGQRCSQHVRDWLRQRLGDGFRFDAPMRAFFESADGTQTLGDALAHWRATRDAGPREIGAQFEYNRFTRAWHEEHPGATQAETIAAWNAYRARPADERGRA